MARRRRKPRPNPLAQYGYPSNKQLRREAGAIANASVPTVRAIERPYGRQRQSVQGFLDAALAALHGSEAQVAATYDTAGATQGAITSAAQARLAGLGLGDYAAGTQAAEGARSDSAASQLNQMGAAARTYASRQPGVATGYAQLQNASINKNLKDALSERVDQRRAAFAQALQTVQAQAMERVNFVAGRQDAANALAMQRAQLAQSQYQFEANMQEQIREFNLSRKDQQEAAGGSASDWRSQLEAGHELLAPTGETDKVPIYSTKQVKDADGNVHIYREITGYRKVPSGDNRSYLQKGISFTQAVSDLQGQLGLSRAAALVAASAVYSKGAGAPFPSPAFNGYLSYAKAMTKLSKNKGYWQKQVSSMQAKVTQARQNRSFYNQFPQVAPPPFGF